MNSFCGRSDVYYSGEKLGELTVYEQGLMTVFELECSMPPISGDVMRLYCLTGGGEVSVGIPVPRGSRLYMKKSFTRNALLSLGISEIKGFALRGTNEKSVVPIVIKKEESAYAFMPESEVMEAAIMTKIPVTAVKEEAEEMGFIMEEAENKLFAITDERENEYFPDDEQAEDDSFSALEDEYDGWSPCPNPDALFSDPEFRKVCSGVKGALEYISGNDALLAVPLSVSEPFPMMPIFCFGSHGSIGGRDYVIFRISDGSLVT